MIPVKWDTHSPYFSFYICYICISSLFIESRSLVHNPKHLNNLAPSWSLISNRPPFVCHGVQMTSYLPKTILVFSYFDLWSLISDLFQSWRAADVVSSPTFEFVDTAEIMEVVAPAFSARSEGNIDLLIGYWLWDYGSTVRDGSVGFVLGETLIDWK